MKKIKVLFILHSKSVDGSLLSSIDLIGALQAYDVEIQIAGKKDLLRLPIFSDFLKRTKITFHPVIIALSYKEKRRIKNSFSYFKFVIGRVPKKICSLFSLLRVIKNLSPDIVHTSTGVVQEGFFASQILSIPHVWHLREYQDRDFGFQFYPSKTVFESLLKYSFSIPITKDIQKHFSLTKNNSKVIYDGVDKEGTVLKFERQEKQKYFLCASRISPEKGHEEVIRAFAKFALKNPEYELRIAGEGLQDYTDKLKRLSKELLGAYSPRVKFLGFQSPENTRFLMSQAQALIVASRSEGFGRMTAEATLHHCLVIGKQTGGTEEIINLCGGIGYSGNYEQLAQKMELLCQLPETEKERMAREASQRAINLFTNEASARQVRDYYDQIIFEKKVF